MLNTTSNIITIEMSIYHNMSTSRWILYFLSIITVLSVSVFNILTPSNVYMRRGLDIDDKTNDLNDYSERLEYNNANHKNDIRSQRIQSVYSHNCSEFRNVHCLDGIPRFLRTPRFGCIDTDGSAMDMILLILSSVANDDRRRVIRSTWANRNASTRYRIRPVFIMGLAPGEYLLNPEQHEFGDILQAEFMDTYRNLTYKTIVAYQWFARHCSSARYLFKTDDDMFINTDRMLNQADSLMRDASVMWGHCIPDQKRYEAEDQRWYVSDEVFPDSIYPAYCTGAGYMLPGRVAMDVAKVMPSVPLIPLEDMFVGVALKRLTYDVFVVSNDGFHKEFDINQYTEFCSGVRQGSLLNIHKVPPDVVNRLYDECYTKT